MSVALILGNGTSRQNIDVEGLYQQVGWMYVCNAGYRDFPWADRIVAIDPQMVEEIEAHGDMRGKFVRIPEEEQFEPLEFSPHRFRENAGMLAMRDAIKHGATELICLGFDFLIRSAEYNLGNVYDGTPGYGPETRASVIDCINRRIYLDWFMSQNPGVNFVFLWPDYLRNAAFRPLKSPNVKFTVANGE